MHSIPWGFFGENIKILLFEEFQRFPHSNSMFQLENIVYSLNNDFENLLFICTILNDIIRKLVKTHQFFNIFKMMFH